MRRSVVALVLVIALVSTFALTGCGGGEPVEPVTPDPAAEEAPPPVVVEEDPDLSPLEEVVYEPFPRSEDALPPDIGSRLDAGQAMIVLFVDRSQTTTDDQEEIIAALQERYRGLIDVVTFDVGRFVTHDEEGRITVNEDINEDDVAAPVARLISEEHLDVRFTPYTVVVDRSGYITWRYRGLSDDKALEREVIRATD